MSFLDGLSRQAMGGPSKGTGLGDLVAMVSRNPQILPALAGLLSTRDGSIGGSGGLAGLVDAFQKKGFGDMMSGWNSTEPNPPVSATQVTDVLGSETLGADTTVIRFPIAFDGWYRVLSSAVGLRPSDSYVSVAGEQVEVRMGWAFRSRFPRSAVVSVSELGRRPMSRGVHGFGGRWLVNGSGDGIVTLELHPPQRAYVLSFPVRLKALLISVSEPAALAAAVGHSVRPAWN
jgi:hypothetical protein